MKKIIDSIDGRNKIMIIPTDICTLALDDTGDELRIKILDNHDKVGKIEASRREDGGLVINIHKKTEAER